MTALQLLGKNNVTFIIEVCWWLYSHQAILAILMVLRPSKAFQKSKVPVEQNRVTISRRDNCCNQHHLTDQQKGTVGSAHALPLVRFCDSFSSLNFLHYSRGCMLVHRHQFTLVALVAALKCVQLCEFSSSCNIVRSKLVPCQVYSIFTVSEASDC